MYSPKIVLIHLLMDYTAFSRFIQGKALLSYEKIHMQPHMFIKSYHTNIKIVRKCLNMSQKYTK